MKKSLIEKIKLKIIDTNEVTQKFKVLFFYILNLIDALITQFLLLTAPDLFLETNPFLSPIVTKPTFLIVKIVIPGLIVIYWGIKYSKANEKRRELANKTINIIISAYLLVLLIHIFNLICHLIYL